MSGSYRRAMFPLQCSTRRSAHEQLSERERALAELPEGYFDEEFDPALHELKLLPPSFPADMLEDVVEQRTTVLDVRQGIGVFRAPRARGSIAAYVRNCLGRLDQQPPRL
jgi:hypothetical protein